MEENKITKLGLHNGGYASRRNLDFYPTPDNVTTALINYLKLPKEYVIWEPASGDGAMSKVFEKNEYVVISSDIREDCYGESGINYLSAEPRKCDAIITNPPFKDSEKFIRKAVAEADVVAMILKSQYFHASKRLGLFKETKPTHILALTWRPNFDTKRGNAPTMEVFWCVWKRGNQDNCIYDLLEKPL